MMNWACLQWRAGTTAGGQMSGREASTSKHVHRPDRAALVIGLASTLTIHDRGWRATGINKIHYLANYGLLCWFHMRTTPHHDDRVTADSTRGFSWHWKKTAKTDKHRVHLSLDTLNQQHFKAKRQL